MGWVKSDISCIYKITNIVNNKIYIGSAISFRNRKSKHKMDLLHNKHSNNYLQRSYNKYGKDNFKFEIIEKCEKDKCIEREQFYLDTLNPDYNICKIAGSTLGVKRSEESRLKQSRTMMGYKHSEETKKKIGIGQIGKKLSEEAKLKIKLSKQNISLETREKIRQSRLGKPYIGTNPTSKNIQIINIQNNIIKDFKSIKEASRELKIPAASISRALELGTITHKKYKVYLNNKEVSNG